MSPLDRRTFLKSTVAARGVAPLLGGLLNGALTPRRKLPVAAIVTEYRDSSHADVIVGKILEGFHQDGGAGADLYLASLFTDQVPEGDMSRRLAAKYGFPIVDTIDEAITLGSDEVKVAGVLSIGEHGSYPYTPDTKQHMYPRRRFFDEISNAFRRTGSVVPVFNDKHLSYRWRDASHMVETAREMKFPLMAGSSLPLTWRRPEDALPIGTQIEEALTIGYGGYESYGFHALETHQSLIERRRGGESGVEGVQALRGDAVWKAEREGRWSRELLEAALAAIPYIPEGKWESALAKDAAWYLMDHSDGLRSSVTMVNGVSRHFAVALRIKGQHDPVVSWFQLQEGKPYLHFAYLVKAIEHLIHTGNPPYPVERTLLTTGILDRVMHSLSSNGKRFLTPELTFGYPPSDWPYANHPASQLRLNLQEPG